MLSYIFALIILALVLVGNTLGPEVTHISMRYFDSILHLATGFGLGFFFAGLTVSLKMRRFNTIGWISFVVFIAGLVWELFEMYYGITGYPLWSKMYYFDTIKDLILDTVGGALACFLIIKR